MVQQTLFTFAAIFAFNGFIQAKTVTIFCHGIVDNQSQIDKYIGHTIFGEVDTVTFPDATPCNDWSLTGAVSQVSTLFGKQVNRDQMYLGQDKDIECLAQKIAQYAGYEIVLYGASRGASTIISYLGKAPNIKNIKAIILEAPAADMLDGADQFSAKLGTEITENIFRKIFYRYPENPYRPVDAVRDIQNKNLPIFITFSAQDSTVHPAQSWILYRAFQECGFRNVYINEVPTGKHCKPHLDPNFQKLYCEPIVAFYKKFRLCKTSTSRLASHKLYSYNLQPSPQYAQEKANELTRQRFTRYKKRRIKKNIALASSTIFLFGLFCLYISKRSPFLKN